MATSAALACLLVLSACSDGSDPEQVVLPSPTASAEAPVEDPTPTPTASAEAVDPGAEIDVTTIPDEITPEYVEAVFAAIETGQLPTVRAVLSEPPNGVGALPTGTRAELENWFEGTLLGVAIALLESWATDEASRTGVLPAEDYTGTRIDVLRIVEANSDCIVAVARRDESGTLSSGGEEDVLSIVSFSSSNGTPLPWRLRDQLRNTGPGGDPNPDSVALSATLEEMSPPLDQTCEAAS